MPDFLSFLKEDQPQQAGQKTSLTDTGLQVIEVEE